MQLPHVHVEAGLDGRRGSRCTACLPALTDIGPGFPYALGPSMSGPRPALVGAGCCRLDSICSSFCCSPLVPSLASPLCLPLSSLFSPFLPSFPSFLSFPACFRVAFVGPLVGFWLSLCKLASLWPTCSLSSSCYTSRLHSPWQRRIPVARHTSAYRCEGSPLT